MECQKNYIPTSTTTNKHNSHFRDHQTTITTNQFISRFSGHTLSSRKVQPWTFRLLSVRWPHAWHRVIINWKQPDLPYKQQLGKTHLEEMSQKFVLHLPLYLNFFNLIIFLDLRRICATKESHSNSFLVQPNQAPYSNPILI